MQNRKVWFEACPGGGCGYFYDADDGKCPWLTESMETAKELLRFLTEDNDLTPEEVETVMAEIRAAGLREGADAKELMMLLEQRQANDFAKLLDQLSAFFF